MNNSINLNDIFSKETIRRRTVDYWNFKSKESRERCGKKYSHLFDRSPEQMLDWRNDFNELSKKQQLLLIKGELIRTYDALPNSDKTLIKNKYKLTTFSSKWFKLPSRDKEKLLFLVL